MSSRPEDLTPQARIRNAAVELFGGQGFDKTTIRQIASRAGVSPGLVIHHFGSKNALREACDDWVVEVLSSEKALLMAGPMPQVQEFVDAHPELVEVQAYLVSSLREGGDMAGRVFDRLHDLTDEMMRLAEDAGLVEMPEDREATITVMCGLSCGLMLVSDLVSHRLGGDEITDPTVLARYSLAATDLMGGVFTPAYREALRAAVQPPDKAEEP